jgi:hypothetical protein
MVPHIPVLLSVLAVAYATVIDLQVFMDDLAVDSAPNCYWSGTSPFCAGACDSGYTDCATDGCGNGACCVTGYKKYCCRGNGCPNRPTVEMPVAESSRLPKTPVVKPEPYDGDHDDICDHKTEFLCCPPGAKKNKQCSCMKLDSVLQHAHGNIFKAQGGHDHDDLCKSKEVLCCNPDATSNKECACIPSPGGDEI